MDQYSCRPTGLVVKAEHRALPPMKIWLGAVRPLPVGSENKRATRPSLRTLSAFCAKAMDVVISSVPSCCLNGVVGQASGVPSLARVASSRVR